MKTLTDLQGSLSQLAAGITALIALIEGVQPANSQDFTDEVTVVDALTAKIDAASSAVDALVKAGAAPPAPAAPAAPSGETAIPAAATKAPAPLPPGTIAAKPVAAG